VSINEHVGRFHSGGIVWVIAQKFAGPNKTMTVETEDIGTTMSHARSLEVGCLATLHTRFGSKLGTRWLKQAYSPVPTSRQNAQRRALGSPRTTAGSTASVTISIPAEAASGFPNRCHRHPRAPQRSAT